MPSSLALYNFCQSREKGQFLIFEKRYEIYFYFFFDRESISHGSKSLATFNITAQFYF